MRVFKHRINTISELIETPSNYGIEIDIRSRGEKLIVVHDPFLPDELTLSDFLANYRHNGLILNVKEEGLEERIQEILKGLNIDDYFFLDQTIPYMLKLLNKGEIRTSHKLSDIESIENLKLIHPKPGWVWVDSWSGNWDHLHQLQLVKSMGYRTCLCSPEVHREVYEDELLSLQAIIKDLNITFDAICTKVPQKWSL